MEQERTRLEGDMKFKNDRKDELREQLYTSYLDTGNFDLAKKNVLMNLDATPTMSEYESLALLTFGLLSRTSTAMSRTSLSVVTLTRILMP